ncbi:MAG TPA: AfsR/SARP family transcriptional regulator [Pseudonocardiaceae bacterium]
MTPTAPKPRVVLAMLALHRDEVVSVDSLAEELWGEQAPRSARATVQSYIVHLRKLVAAALPRDGARLAKEIVVTTPGGYRLDTAGGEVDVSRFERLAEAGHRARQQGDFAGAARNFAAALASWRGPALVDVQQGPHLAVDATRLGEARLNVVACRVEADLRLGRHHELLGELAALVARYRTHEGLSAHFMLALYRSGRRCEALDVYRRLRDRLAEEQGLEPTPPLRRLQRSMLVPDRGADELMAYLDVAAEGRRPSGPGAAGAAAAPTRGIPAELATIPWDAHDVSTGHRPPLASCSSAEYAP